MSHAGFESEARKTVSPEPADPALLRTIEAMEPPPYRTPIRRLLTDRTDLVWVELDVGQPERHEWLVTDTVGTVRARVTTPDAVNLLEIGEDYVIGLWRDTLGVEYVQMHRLERR